MINLILRILTKLDRRITLYNAYGIAVAHKYFLFRKELPGYEKSNFNIYLHEFLTDSGIDSEVGLHSHPFDAYSIILRGQYVELLATGRRVRKTGTIKRIGYDEKHAIIESKPGTVSLFVTGKLLDEWVAHDDNGIPIHITDFYSNATKIKVLTWAADSDYDILKKLRIRKKAMDKLGVTKP